MRLVDVHPAAGACCYPWGDPDPTTFHWVLADPTPLTTPIPGRGQLSLYTPSADVMTALNQNVTR